jgi:hypothetical protein
LSEDWITHYEELRRQALGEGANSAHGVGMGVLMRRGMAAWLEACSRCSTHVDVKVVAQAVPSTVPQGLRDEITEVLTSMVLSCGGEMRT